MKTYYANPNYSSSSNDDNWVVVGAQSADVATNDLTQLSVGNISAPTSSTTTGYYFAQVEDLSRLTKGWSYLTKTSLGPRNQANQTLIFTRPQYPSSEPYVYVAEINGFENGDRLAVLEGQQENQDPFSNAATSSDFGGSQWSYVQNAGLIPTVSILPTTAPSAFLQPENAVSVASRLSSYNSLDFGDTNYNQTDVNGTVLSTSTKNYGSDYTPTPDDLGQGTIYNWYLTASGDDTAKSNVLTMLPDFTTEGETVTSVQVGQTATTVTLGATNAAFRVGQTLTIATNGTAVNGNLPSPSKGVAAMGWFAGKITSISGATLYTDLNDTTANTIKQDPLPGSINSNVGFTGTISTTTTITVGAYSATANYGLAVGQTVTGGTYISAGTTITGIAGNSAGAVLTLSQAVAGGVGTTNVSLTGNFTDYNLRAYAATITDYTLRVNHINNKLDCRYSTSPYYSQVAYLTLSTALSTTGATTQIVVKNNDVYDYYANGVFALRSGDNYQEITVTGATFVTSGSTGTLTVASFTPNFAYPSANTSLANTASTKNLSADRYGRVLVFPVVASIYRNAPVAQFKGMTALASGITETINGSTYYYGTVGGTGGTYYSSDPYTVAVDNVSNIKAGDTLTFRSGYNPWFSNYPTGQPVIPIGSTATTGPGWYQYGDAVPWTWTLTDLGVGFTCTSGATFINLPDANGYALPLVKGQSMVTIGATAYVPINTKVSAWNATQIFLDTATAVGTTAASVNLRFYPGSSGYNYWKVYSVNSADNTFVIYGSPLDPTTTNPYDPSSSAYSTNGDNQNYIFDYNSNFYAGNTVDISSTTGQGAGVVGLYNPNLYAGYSFPESTLGWHTTNTVVGSYAEGGRYIGSQSVGDQEQVIPSLLGSAIGSTLSLDIIAQTSTAFAVSPLPNSAVTGLYNSGYSQTAATSDTNQYGMAPSQASFQNGGFAVLGDTAVYPGNYDTGRQFPLVVGSGETQEVVMAYRSPVNSTGTYEYATPVDGGLSLNVPMLWNLAAGQSFHYDHAAGEPVCTPNFIYKTAGTISHAANAPVIGLPNTGTVYG